MSNAKASIFIFGVTLFASSIALASKDAYFVKVDRDTTIQNGEQGDSDKKVAPKNENATNLPTGKRQHKPFVITKELENKESDEKANTGLHKSGDVTLKRGIGSK